MEIFNAFPMRTANLHTSPVRVRLVLFVCMTVSVRVSAKVRVSLVWFVISNSIGGVKCRHLPSIAKVPVSANNIVPIRTYVSANNISRDLKTARNCIL